MRNYIKILSLLFFLKCNIAFAQKGTLDTAFANNGIFKSTVGSIEQSIGNILAIQKNGKILVGGYSNGAKKTFSILRLNYDGSLDNSFGQNGIVATSLDSTSSSVKAIAIQTDGRILVAGKDSTSGFVIVRYTQFGKIDSSLGINGICRISFNINTDKVCSILLQKDGKIIVGGSTYVNNKIYLTIVRFLSNGVIDSTYNGNGKVITNFNGNSGDIFSIKMQIDGKIVVAGSGINNTMFLSRLLLNGLPDSSFNGIGFLSILPNSNGGAFNLTFQENGDIIAMGSISHFNASPPFDGYDSIVLVKLNSFGKIDSSFGINGVTLSAFSSQIAFGYDILSLSDSKIIVAGGTSLLFDTSYTGKCFTIGQFTKDGNIDNGFGQGGKVKIFNAGYNNSVAMCIALDSSGRIVVAGYDKPDSNYNYLIARFLSDKVLDVKDIYGEVYFTLSPNPVSSTLHITTTEKYYQTEIYDLNGRIYPAIISKDQIDVSTLLTGIYLLRLKTEKGSVVKKFVKE